MFGIHDVGIFLGTGILLNLTPGPDTLYIVGRSAAQGRAIGIASALGIATGSLVHTLAAAAGLSALLASSAMGFVAIKLFGASYLTYCGLRMLVSRRRPDGIPMRFGSPGVAAAYRQGLLTNVLNPKVALFFLAFMPQFIAADSPSRFAAFVILGLCFTATGTVWSVCLAWFASLIGERLQGSSSVGDVLNRAVGALFVGLGVRLALTK
jgi:threonine/homoserine/homoserine lactone efflux protein